MQRVYLHHGCEFQAFLGKTRHECAFGGAGNETKFQPKRLSTKAAGGWRARV
jgi:hypothetical protein